MESSEKSCFFKKFLWTTRKQCQRPCQKNFSQIQKLRSNSAKDEKSRKCFLGCFFSHRWQPCQKFSSQKYGNFPLEAPKIWKNWGISKTNPQTLQPDTKNAVSQSLQAFWPQTCKNLWTKSRKWWKKKLLTKKIFFLKTFL